MKLFLLTLHNVCAVHWGDSCTLGSIMNNVGDFINNVGRKPLEKQLNLDGNPLCTECLQCTHNIPHTHHDTLLSVLMVSIWCTEHTHPTHPKVYS